MANNVEIKLNSAGIRELLKSQGIKNECVRLASAAAARCGNGYGYRAHDTEQRTIVNVYAETRAARKDNLKNNTLLRSVHQ